MADVRISALPQQQTPLTGLELVPIVQNGLTVQTTLALIGALSAGGVTTFSGGATGLLPSSPTVGAITLAGMLNATFGGTGIAAYAAGDLLRANSTTTLQRLAIGTNGQVLTVVAGAPAWAAVNAGTVTSVSGTGTVNGLTLTGTVTSSGNLTLGGVLDLSSPPAIGGTAAAAGTFTTLRVDSTISLAGSTGTAGYVLTSQGASAPTWTAVSSGSGNVVGPASATANGIALFDGTTGLLIKDSASTDALIQGMTLGLGSGAGNFASTALGVNALLSNTTGSYNVAFGYDALSSNTTGEYHSAFGFQALDSQTTGTENTAVGYYALQSTNTGSYNTAIGGFAGSDLTTGSNNLFLGVNSGNNLTTGANNVYIGNCFAFSPSESDVIAFGNGTGERFRITDTGAWYISADTGTSGQVFTSNGSTTNPTWTSLGTMAGQNRDNVDITGGYISGCDITVKDNVFTLQDNVDPTKQAQFQLSAIGTGVTATYTMPAVTGTIAALNATQTFTAVNSFTASFNTFGASTITGTQAFGTGATVSGATKTVNVGTGGLSGSTTTITVGSVNGSTTTLLGTTAIGGAAGNQSLQVNNVASAVNYLQVVGAVTTGAPVFSAQGTDTNISLPIISKGTGAIDLAAGSSGVNISNGGTVTALTFGAVGFSYTAQPTITIAAPTTAGGVQATAAVRLGINTAPVASGGTGYTVGDVLTVVGGTPVGGAATLTVTAVSGGVITSVNSTNFAAYITIPTSPVSVTGGTGSGATFNPLYYTANLVITNAGSGYVEQPSVSFSIAPATAYATIGSGTAIKSLGTTMSLSASAGEVLRLSDNGGTSANFLLGLSGISGVQPQLRSTGETNTNLLLGSNGTGAVRFTTLGGSAVEQVRVSHTASAVNYLNLTGAATGATPTISAQGSDANIGLNLTTKGFGSASINTGTGMVAQFQDRGTATITSPFVFRAGTVGAAAGTFTMPVAISIQIPDDQYTFKTNAATTGANSGLTQFTIVSTASAVNYVQVKGAGTNAAPELSAQGSDTNINLKLTPKGTGVLQFGTYTAGIIAQAGFITITDAGGTSRRLLVG